MINQSFTHC